MIHLAVDLGSKRIGLAISDEGELFAFPLRVLVAEGLKKDALAVLEAARAEQAGRVVVGLPLNMDGSEGEMAQKARRFAALLQAGGMEVCLHDERMSSYTAEVLVKEKSPPAHRRKPKTKSQTSSLDAQAAAVFLQSYLDGKKRGDL